MSAGGCSPRRHGQQYQAFGVRFTCISARQTAAAGAGRGASPGVTRRSRRCRAAGTPAPRRAGSAAPAAEAYGLTLVPPAEGLARLAETLEILRRTWTRDVFDFHGAHHRLRSTRSEPRPPGGRAPARPADARCSSAAGAPAAAAGRRAGRHRDHPRTMAAP
ncbi:LLM class flavin-dependent oxidoreductase [Streptomyces sp. YKOK-I1]